MPPHSPTAPSGTFSALLSIAIDRLLHNESLDSFCDWFARDMGALVMETSGLPPDERDTALRYQRTVARTIWAAVPVPSNRWRSRSLPKVERNDPCHCGSGRKFKQCCAGFSDVMPPLEPEQLYVLALAQATPDMLTADKLQQVPGEALGMAAMEWNEQGQASRTVSVLEPLFAQPQRLDARYEIAFDALSDAMRTLGQETRRRALALLVSQCHDKELATTARCRHVSMLADTGDFEAAWALFHSTQRLNPANTQLLPLELTLLLSQGRDDEARLRAPLLAAKARRAGLPELGEVLIQMAQKGRSAIFDVGADAETDDPDDLDWIALCEQVPAEFSADECRDFYSVQPFPPDEAGQAPVLSIKPIKKSLDLQRRWQRRFATEKPMMTSLTGDASSLLDDLPAVQNFLQKNPQAWLSMEVLDDLLLAAAELCDWDAPQPVIKAARQLAAHALKVLCTLIGEVADTVPAQLHWIDPQARPLLRVVAQTIELARLQHDNKTVEALCRWGLALNPHDNHGWRSMLVPLYLGQSRFGDALALLDLYPNDFPPSEHCRALALFALGRRDEAEAVLRQAHADYPLFLAALLPEVLDQPEDEDGPGLRIGGTMAAFYHRTEVRAAWIGTGALAWARALQLPEPKPARKPKPPTKRKATGLLAPADSSAIGTGEFTAAIAKFGAAQDKHLRKNFPDYARLHGLLMAIAWSPDLVMPSQWLPMVMAMRGAPLEELPEAKALKAANADLDAIMRLLNSLNTRLLDTAPDQPAPIQDVIQIAAHEPDLFSWAAGFVQGAEVVASAWRRAGHPVSSSKGVFGELFALAARADTASHTWRASHDSGQPLLIGLESEQQLPIEILVLALHNLWRVVAPLRHARLAS